MQTLTLKKYQLDDCERKLEFISDVLSGIRLMFMAANARYAPSM
jgi:hypothetical protein